jgi:subtilisin
VLTTPHRMALGDPERRGWVPFSIDGHGPRWAVRLLLGVWLSLILVARQGNAAAEGVPRELYQKAFSEGSVRVIAQLRVHTTAEGHLEGAQAVRSQRNDIASVRSTVLAELGGSSHRKIREFETIPFVALEVGLDALSKLEESMNVVALEEDRLESLLLSQSVPLIGADQAWTDGFDGTGMVVAILDSGVDKTLAFLSGKVVEEACFSANGSCPNGLSSQTGSGAGVPCTYAPNGCRHGTFVAGIAAGAGSSFSGVARGARLIVVQVFSRFIGGNCTGEGEDPCAKSFVSDQIAGLERVFALRAQYAIAAVNMSIGSGRFTSPCDSTQAASKAVIDNLRSVGIATIVASGNDGFPDGIDAPACISTAISVGSSTKADTVSSFSNSASFLSLLAPGESIISFVPGGGLAIGSGTSFGAPHVTGAWAILKQRNPSATVGEVLAALTSTGLPITDPKNGITKPRIRVNLALHTSSPLAAQAFVTRLYEQVLNREPDSDGLQGFIDQIAEFGSVVPTVLAFFQSQEFLGRNTSNAQFLTILYHTFLDRDPDPSGFNAFLADLQSGLRTRDNLLDIFLDSHEFASLASFLPPQDPVTAFVTTLYVRILGRGPDQAGLQGSVTQLEQTRTVLPTVNCFLASQEFLDRHATNTEFVTLLYRVFLNRVPDAAGLTGFVATLNQEAVTRAQLASQFAAAPEFQAIQHQLFP